MRARWPLVVVFVLSMGLCTVQSLPTRDAAAALRACEARVAQQLRTPTFPVPDTVASVRRVEGGYAVMSTAWDSTRVVPFVCWTRGGNVDSVSLNPEP